MFQKQVSLLFVLMMFIACGNAKPTPELESTVEKQEVEHHNLNVQETEVPVIDNQAKESEVELKKPEVKPIQKVENKEEKREEAIEVAEEVALVVSPEEVVEVVETPTVEEEPVAIAHDKWNALLKKYVSAQGNVNYDGFNSDKKALQVYLEELAANPIQKSWSRNEKMAYWINAYNAFTVKLILDNYPVSSIMKINGGKAWDKKWIKLGDKTYSLNQIENDILRPQFKDPRIHFAVNCAAKSCPPLLNEAWTANNLEKNFEKQARNFINNSNYNKISEKKVQLSNIFEWYAGDFGDIVTFLNKYSKVKIKANAKVSFLNYNWDLNK